MFFFPELMSTFWINLTFYTHTHTKDNSNFNLFREEKKKITMLQKKPTETEQKIRKKANPTGLQVKGCITEDCDLYWPFFQIP